MICHFNTEHHDGRAIAPVRRPMTDQVFLMCTGCREVTGWRVTERRVRDVPVAHDRRRWVPRWLDRLTARDETGAAA